ncbi:hypothetical protein [Sphingomonas faeni]|uniref:hypothetical protein n=1 Tax=Sphingomonas faeni TaxID=185950 RepID=UPI00277DE6E7|nr:hypothetical protein [Sphingomonas faeni]MDQ0839188.1 hypothetical protein [Sphingomonas faeni]
MNRSKALTGGADEMLQWAFGGSLPVEELEAWLAASPVRRDAILRRLGAIKAWTELPRGDPEGIKERLCEDTGLAQGALRNIVQSWKRAEAAVSENGRDGRSLSLLRLRTEPHARPVWGAKQEAHEVVKTIVRGIEGGTSPDSGVAVDAVVTSVLRDPRFKKVDLAQNAVRRIVHELRAAPPAQLILGRHITFDEVSLALRDDHGRGWRCTIVLDVGSRLALGAAVVTDSPGPRTLAVAARTAARYLDATPLPGIAAAEEETTVTVAITDQGVMEMLRVFSRQAGWMQQEDSPGRLVRAALGPSLGRVRMVTGEGASSLDPDDFPVVNRKQVIALLSRAMSRHNDSLIGDGPENEATTETRKKLSVLLRNAARTLWQ